MEFILTIAVVVLFVMTINQKSRIEIMEQTLARFRPVSKKKTESQSTDEPKVHTDHATVAKPLESAKTANVLPHKPTNQVNTTVKDKKDSVSFEVLLVKKILPTLGVLSVVLGVGFLVTWSYSNGYLGPKGLVTLGALFSMAVVVTGELLRTSFRKYFAYLSSAGMLGLGVCVYTSEVVYGFIDSTTAFGLYIVLTAASFALAYRYNSRIMSLLSAVGGFIVPFVIQAPDSSPYIMITYSSILFVAGACMMYTKRWIETTLATLTSLLVYALLMLQYVGNSYELLSVNPVIYLFWIFAVMAMFVAISVVTLVKDKTSTQEGSLAFSSQTTAVVATLTSLLLVNYLAYEVFRSQNWDYFGFFVLAQSFAMFGIAELMKQHGLTLFQQLFTIGTLTGVVFATIWELGFADYPMLTSLLLLAQSALYVFARKAMEGGIREIFTVFALATQAIATVMLFGIDDFMQLSLVLWASVALALYHAYNRFDREITDSKLALLQIIYAIVMVVIWTFILLPGELLGNIDVVVPQLFGLVYVVALLVFSRKLVMNSLMYLAEGVAVISSLSFMAYAWRYDSVELIGAGLVLVSFFAFVVSLAKRMKSYFGIEESLHEHMIRFTAFSTALWVVYVAYWALSDPVTSIVVMLAGVVYVIVGLQKTLNVVRFVGLCMVGYILVKMYLVDIWSWSTLWRFVAMLPMGLLLISLPFWYQKLKKD